ncbi:DgyrCDS835 [Dimorphilus gyrociliatus]|uniref:DgyrCDS835 n=1 Tax=Dimorphilus gyrociliatus TaxID=2664684 RepID=A0A7I8V5P6_9ANNE|nr:DgyrCDS835 [Dimorphilus gyrociliatus]
MRQQQVTTIPKICKTGYKLNIAVSPEACERCDPNLIKDVTTIKLVVLLQLEVMERSLVHHVIQQLRVYSLNGSAVECTSCLATYGFKGTSGELCGIEECQMCSVPRGGRGLVCLTCSNKFYLNSDDSGQCPKFCKECSYNQKYECTECYDRYAKASDGTCVPCPSNCETCTANADKTTRCTKCISKSFSLKTDGTCVPCSEAAFANCATCGPTPSGGKAKCDMQEYLQHVSLLSILLVFRLELQAASA